MPVENGFEYILLKGRLRQKDVPLSFVIDEQGVELQDMEPVVDRPAVYVQVLYPDGSEWEMIVLDENHETAIETAVQWLMEEWSLDIEDARVTACPVHP